ncbi:hypothetical protein CC1G_15089 [Coprinopsis cinerea okayama7|uniref:Uncharacterized protein n=1 Tax=Coprinopsis cinerea (strain Okayama-7 / 130 / ATCC MYA-4618 / FGSC 9003) TaxID=240176 RepID=D6RPF6_COPC7|nr:hypothetical protein CC1G_15089 [Coprinopsis cinerea okayama7\|eukprot:XP_002910755.1 hypothetical protein CC1G_15089 [Coprinopsis cinerea okayama7\
MPTLTTKALPRILWFRSHLLLVTPDWTMLRLRPSGRSPRSHWQANQASSTSSQSIEISLTTKMQFDMSPIGIKTVRRLGLFVNGMHVKEIDDWIRCLNIKQPGLDAILSRYLSGLLGSVNGMPSE